MASHPGQGEPFLAGDTINTASRIQSVAPQGGVAVGLATFEATRDAFDYADLPPATLKGKAEPVAVFQPTSSIAAHGSPPRAILLQAHSSGGRRSSSS